jgi:hypothetical protein
MWQQYVGLHLVINICFVEQIGSVSHGVLLAQDVRMVMAQFLFPSQVSSKDP